MNLLKPAPGGALWLLKNELRLFWRKGDGKKSMRIVLVIAALAWLGISWLIFRPLSEIIPPPPLGDAPTDAMALAAISIVIAFISTLIVSQGLQRTIEAIYLRNDLDLLLSAPLKAWTILIVRSAGVAISTLPLYAFLIGPPILWLSIFNSPIWLTAVPTIVALAFGGTGVALLLVTVLFRLIGPKRTRIAAQLLSLLIGATIFILFQLPNFSRRFREDVDEDQILERFEALNINPDAPYFLPARAVTGDILAMLLIATLCGLLFSLGVWIFSRRYVTDAAAASAMEPRRNTAAATSRSMRPGLLASIVRKELRLLFRDTVLLSRIGLQIVYLIPVAYLLMTPGDGGALALPAFAPVLTMLATSLAGSLAWITISAEDAPDLVASSPAGKKLIERGKLIAAILPVTALMSIPLATLVWRNPVVGAWCIGGVIAGATCAAFIGLWRQTPGSRNNIMKSRGKGSFAVAMGQTFVALGLSATVGLGAYGFPWLAILPAVLTAAVFAATHKSPDQAAALQ